MLNEEALCLLFNLHKMDITQKLDSVKQLELKLKEQPERKIAVVYEYYQYSKIPITVVDAYFDETQARQMIVNSENLKQNKNYYLATGTIKDFEEGFITHKNTKTRIMEGPNRTSIYMSLAEKTL